VAVQLIVPFRGGCEHRERAWRWLRDRYEAEGWDVIEAPAPDGPWCKGAAVTPAVEASKAPVIVVADADCWTGGLNEVVAAVRHGARWGMPHGKVYRLTEAATNSFLAGEVDDLYALLEDRRSLARRAYPGVWGGGVVVVRRDVYLEAPIDPRFLNWGNEDTAWARALKCLAGDGWQGSAPLVHLWHPPEPRIADDRGSKDGWNHFLRYHRAAADPDAMRALIKEARCLSPAC
jgi:hypothetical protein